MTDERAAGATYSLDQIGWIDFETKGLTSLKEVGAYRYATQASAIVLAYAIGGGPVRTVAVKDSVARSTGRPAAELYEHHQRVAAGKAVWAAWNAGFDKAIWNYATDGFPEMEPHHIIDVMAQGAASGLPPDLDLASVVVGGAQKDKSGSDLIKLFCLPDSEGTPQTHPAEWAAVPRLRQAGHRGAARGLPGDAPAAARRVARILGDGGDQRARRGNRPADGRARRRAGSRGQDSAPGRAGRADRWRGDPSTRSPA